jgi:hypothetical protein
MSSLTLGRRWTAVAFLLWLVLLCGSAGAQQLTPRSYAPNPTGGNILLLSYARSTGGVLFDPALPFDDVNAAINTGTLLYGRTFGLFGRAASAQVGLPYVVGDIDGFVEGEYQKVTRSGLTDLRGKFTVNLLGGPALSPREFASSRRDTILGASVSVVAPTGQYDPSKLINIGSNRWSVKPELGVSKVWGRWYAELYGGVWFFGTNTSFYGGSVREQAPIGTLQAHVSYFFKPRLWLAVDATFYTGGRTTLDGTVKPDLQANTRGGVTLALPVAKRSALRLTWSRGFTTRIGADFDTLGAALQLVWFRNPWGSGS